MQMFPMTMLIARVCCMYKWLAHLEWSLPAAVQLRLRQTRG